MEVKQIIKRLFLCASGCELLKHTRWYEGLFVGADHEIYPDNVWYREHDERNFDLVNLGSSGGKWAFDYSDENIKAMNWAQQPQTLVADYNLLRNFHSILHPGGVVIITIMPFTSLNKETNLMDAVRYLKIGAHEPIQPHLYGKARRYAEYPILFKKSAVKGLLKYFLHRESSPKANDAKAMLTNNPMDERQLEADAQRWVDGWKRQFGIRDFEAPLTEQNKRGQEFRVEIMRQLIDFCMEREYRPVYVIPPVTRHLARYYTRKFEEMYVYGFLREVSREIPLLDYSKDGTLQSDSYYFNSFFLNQRGRKLFTHRVLEDLRRLELLDK